MAGIGLIDQLGFAFAAPATRAENEQIAGQDQTGGELDALDRDVDLVQRPHALLGREIGVQGREIGFAPAVGQLLVDARELEHNHREHDSAEDQRKHAPVGSEEQAKKQKPSDPELRFFPGTEKGTINFRGAVAQQQVGRLSPHALDDSFRRGDWGAHLMSGGTQVENRHIGDQYAACDPGAQEKGSSAAGMHCLLV